MRQAEDSEAIRHADPLAPGLRDEISGSRLDPGRSVIWRRTMPLLAEFELRQGETVFGEMEPAHTAEADATGECLGHSLEIGVEAGLLRGIRVESHVSGSGEEGPGFRGLLFGWGRVETAAGESLRWRHAFSRMYDHVLFDEAGEELLRLRPAFLRFGRTETRVIISPLGWGRADLPELLLLTWFLRVHTEARGRRAFRRSKRRMDRDFP